MAKYSKTVSLEIKPFLSKPNALSGTRKLDSGKSADCAVYCLVMTSSSTRPRLAATINTVRWYITWKNSFLTGKAQYPVVRTLLTNGILIAGIDSLYQNQRHMPKPHLDFKYLPNPESTFWRS